MKCRYVKTSAQIWAVIEIAAGRLVKLVRLEIPDINITLKTSMAVSACLIFLAAGIKAQVPQSKSYSYPSDGFQASFPSEPTLNKRNVDTQKGSFELRSYVSSDSSFAYYVGVCDYGNAGAGLDPDTVLEHSKDGALENTNSQLIKEEKIKLGDVPGLAYESETNEMYFTARIYIVGTTLYQVLVVYPIGNAPPDAESFLESFGLITRSEQ